LAQSLAHKSQKGPSLAPEVAPSISPPAGPVDPDLVRMLDAWPGLPDPIRRAIVALVESVTGGP
jgi:hypothetical protein